MSEENEQQEDVSELRKAAEGGKQARMEADLAKRELAFVKAGVNTDTKPAQALLKSYDGPLDVDAIKAEAREWSLLDAEPAADDTPDYTAEQQQQEMRDNLGGDAAPDIKPEIGGIDAALETFKEERTQGFGQTEATNRAIGRVIQSAARGDSQAVFDPVKWEQEQADAGHGAQWAR